MNIDRILLIIIIIYLILNTYYIFKLVIYRKSLVFKLLINKTRGFIY